MASNEPLFPYKLIHDLSHQSLPEGYSFRPLQRSDFEHGHVEVLRDLAYIGPIDEKTWISRFDAMKKRADTYFILVIVMKTAEGERIIGTGTLIVELKFIGELGLQGHLEDIAIAKEYHGKGLGSRLIKALDCIAGEMGCYKSILSCGKHTMGFYEKCGYGGQGIELQRYHDPESTVAKHGV